MAAPFYFGLPMYEFSKNIADHFQNDFKALIDPLIAKNRLTHAEALVCDFMGEDLRYLGFKENERCIYDLASITKASVTAPLIFFYINKLGCSLNSKIADFVRDKLSFDPRLCELTFSELLSHCSGLPAWRNFWIEEISKDTPTLLRNRDFLAKEKLNYFAKDIRVDKEGVYSDVGYILLGVILEIIGEDRLDHLFSGLLDELELDSKALCFNPIQKDQCITSGMCSLRKRELIGEVHDENAYAFGGVSGHAGLFGSLDSFKNYLLKLLNHPVGREFFEKNHSLVRDGNDFLLGLRQGFGPSLRSFANGRGIGHLGFTGTAFLLDWEKKKLALFFTNRVVSGRDPNWMVPVRNTLFRILDEL